MLVFCSPFNTPSYKGLSHPITTNLDPIHFDFVSSIDTVSTDADIKKTVLLHSSKGAQSRFAPVKVASSVVDLPPEYFKNLNSPFFFALLLEGKFHSHFIDLLPPDILNDEDVAFREVGKPSAMVVISDGDICKNKVIDKPSGRPSFYPLGYDRYAKRVVYDNKEFF